MNVRLKRAKELMGYAIQLTKDEGLPTMVKRGAGFVRRRFFGKRARYLPGKKVLEAQAAEMVGKTAENCGLPTISILTPLYNTPENYLREFLGSFVNQTAPNGQLCLADASDDAHPEVERVVREYQQKNQRIVYKKVENKGIAANTNAAETLATGEYLALADHDDVLAPHAMYAMGKAVLQLREKGEPDGFLYSDEALFTKDIKKPMVGHFKPDYAPDYLLCCNYICHLAVFKRALYEQLGGERPECDGSQDHDLFLRLIEQTGGAAHVPQVLYYWRVHAGSTSGGTDAKPYVAAAAKKALTDHLSRTGRTGTVEDGLFPSTYRVKWDIEGDPKVSILIPNKDHTDDLEKCLYSIWSKTEWDNFEVIVIENNSTDPATFAYYKDAEKRYEGLKVVTWPEKGFNFSAINNFGRKAAQGEYLLLLNNDVEVRNGDWLTELLRQCAIQILTGQLLPMAEVVTPNIPEAEILSGMTITDAAGMEAAAKCISEKYGCAVLCKGGHKVNDADDLLWRNGSGKWFHGERIANPNTHGTGCTLSSAIASNLAKGYPLDAAVERAKAYISGCLSAMLDLGKGSGPMDHMFALRGEFVEH